MKQVGLRILFGTNFLDIVVAEEQAQKIIEDWLRNPQQEGHFSDRSAAGMWAVRRSAITAMHTIDLASREQGMQQQIGQPLPPPGSGAYRQDVFRK